MISPKDSPQAPGRRRATAVFAERSGLAAARAAGHHRSLLTVARQLSPTGGGGRGRVVWWGPADQLDEAKRDKQQDGDDDGHCGGRVAPEDEGQGG